MTVRPATAADAPRLMTIRLMVRENRLTGPAIPLDDYLACVSDRRCWVWAEGGRIEGFSALEADHAVLWALFVDPAAEGRGIGRALLAAACDTARVRGTTTLMLTTQPESRAEAVYARFGFAKLGTDGNGDVRMRLAL